MSYLNVIGVGNSVEYLQRVPDNSVDACVCDPPYGLGDEPSVADVMKDWLDGRDYQPKGTGFLGKEWDAFVPGPEIWKQVIRVLKPGGYLIAFFGTRTYDWGTMAIRIAGFEIIDQLDWIYGSGFPKGQDLSKGIDKKLGVYDQREVIGEKVAGIDKAGHGQLQAALPTGRNENGLIDVTAPASEEAAAWEGWNTQMKPAHEPMCLARKPMEGTFVENVLKHGTSALNIDESRIGFGKQGRYPTNVILGHLDDCKVVGTEVVKRSLSVVVDRGKKRDGLSAMHTEDGEGMTCYRGTSKHVGDVEEEVDKWECAEGCPVLEMGNQSGESKSRPSAGNAGTLDEKGNTSFGTMKRVGSSHSDSGTAARFFYSPKAQTKHRWAYCKTCDLVFKHISRETFAEHDGHDVLSHPTQKPIKLMEYLIRLVTQKGGVVLDPYCGTGTTAVAAKRLGYNFVTCELSPDYAQIASARVGEVGVRAETTLASGAYFCPGCKAKGEIKLLSKADIELLEQSGKKITCRQCLKRYSYEDLKGSGS
jgi:site-specific DNA-methyltransferase (adenine-specific)